MAQKKEKKVTGRPKIEIDFELVKKLAGIFCTGEEIAGVLEINYDTLNTRTKEEFGVSFSDYIKKYNEQGKASLRRMQYKAANAGNVSMQIWLGKQYLNQKDRCETQNEHKISGVSKALSEVLEESGIPQPEKQSKKSILEIESSLQDSG